jgi:hypothetical protein
MTTYTPGLILFFGWLIRALSDAPSSASGNEAQYLMTENMPWTLIPNRITVKTINLQFYLNRIIIEWVDYLGG